MSSPSGLKPRLQLLPGQFLRRGASALMATAVLLLLVWAAFQGLQLKWFPTSVSTSEVRSLLISELQGMTELTTARMSAKATVVISQDRKLGDFSLGDTNLVYEGVGEVQAGIDLMQLQATQVDWGQQRIQILLPPPEITNVTLNVNRSSVLASYKRWFGPDVELELQEQAQREALRQIQAQACAAKLLNATNANAKQVVEQILRTAGYKDISVATQLPKPGTCPAT